MGNLNPSNILWLLLLLKFLPKYGFASDFLFCLWCRGSYRRISMRFLPGAKYTYIPIKYLMNGDVIDPETDSLSYRKTKVKFLPMCICGPRFLVSIGNRRRAKERWLDNFWQINWSPYWILILCENIRKLNSESLRNLSRIILVQSEPSGSFGSTGEMA